MSTQPLHAQLLSRLQAREERAEFLANASQLMIRTSKLIADELDMEGTLASVARLALPHRGVWTILDVREVDGTRRVAVAHPVHRQQTLARALLAEWPAARDLPGGRTRVMRTGVSETVANVTDAMLTELAASPRHLNLLRALRMGSILTVRLACEGRVIGSLAFVGPRWGHPFDERDRILAEDIATGAARAIVNAQSAETAVQLRAAAQIAEAERLTFMASLSHTFRTPLHSIYGYAQLLDGDVRGALTGPQRDDVHRIQANERHLLNLVNAVVSFAKWDDAASLQLEDVDVRAAVRLTNDGVTSAALIKGVTYHPDTDAIAADLVVRADPARLHEILLQLMLNAVKFSHPLDRVSVQAAVVGERVWIRVEDTGIGITKEDLPLVFQPFVRARDEYARGQPGVGLGLAIARKLARAMGGELFVASERGHGSTFTLSLLRGREKANAAAQSVHPH